MNLLTRDVPEAVHLKLKHMALDRKTSLKALVLQILAEAARSASRKAERKA